ncbi:UvrD-helicase domain-containing protein [Streptomyces sp. NPDC093089]|uniref:UvrD-helicase domain-containing protein n=1 Tax=Streptomyces sp. NPDC093089 TaxID=3366024 RepID=UPI0037F8775F
MTPDEAADGPRTAAEAQQLLAVQTPAPAYVPACPGAGKTHVIALRHLQSPPRLLRQGRALISFTRVARDQMAQRCRQAGRTDLLHAPHFVGTLDSFLWEFLVKPLRPTQPPVRLLESWANVKAPVQGLDREIPLHRFHLTLDPVPIPAQEAIAWDKIDHDTQRLLDDSAYDRDAWLAAVLSTRKSWCQKGYFTGHEARILALWNLRNPQQADRLLPPLLSRFAEVVVDEAQDCSTADLVVLELLHDAGLPLVLVGDPDQAIYAWRGAQPASLQRFAAKLNPVAAPLTGNWRSSPVICRLASTLRAGNRAPDTAVVKDDDIPVVILPTRFAGSGSNHRHAPGNSGIVEVFRDIAQEYGIKVEDCLVTAHKYATLPGITREKPNSNQITHLAWARTVAHTEGATSSELIRACAVALRVLFGYWFPEETGSPERLSATHRLPLQQANRTAFSFLHSLPPPHKEWATDVWQAMKAWPAPPDAAPQGTKGRLAGKPVIARPVKATAVRTNIVHQLKGDEADAVMLMLPDNGSVQRWAQGDPATDELLRIWYVAVTRARRLAALAVSEEEVEGLAQLLCQHAVPARIG